jgi:NAD(P)-dependent dehydrogenase (short-subunit alcohol dehydrogenase family)
MDKGSFTEKEKTMQLQGKVAIVTGAGSGMGRAMAMLFAAEGARVVAGDWNAQTLDSVMAEVRGAGGEISGAQGNIAEQATAEGLVNLAVSAYGRLDVLVNNAGVMDLNQGVGELTNEMWRRVFGINLDGPMFTMRAAIPIMRQQGGGSIINIASVAGLSGAAAGAAYTAAKHALVGLTKNTAWMYTQQGIRCNAICPGATETNIISSVNVANMDVEGSKRTGLYTAIIPGMLQPVDIARLALFLASDASRYLNGTAIPADAGWLAA